MRTRSFLLSLGLVLLLVVVGAIAAIAQPEGPDDGNDGNDGNGDGGNGGNGTELTLYAEEDSFTWISAEGEVNPDEETAPSPGDRFVVVDTIFSDEDRTDEVGRNDLECTFTEASEESGSVVCHGVVTLDDQGTLAWQASAIDITEESNGGDEPFVTVALTGGTGDFTAAGGEVEIFDTTGEDGETATSRYEVTLLEFRSRS